MDVRGLRFPTVEEIKSIMSFPFSYEFFGEDVWRQLGNAVPPLMSYKIASSVEETIM
jgi:site-specific DNA-cytosine methylase